MQNHTVGSAFVGEVEYMVNRCILGSDAPLSTLDDAIDALKIIQPDVSTRFMYGHSHRGRKSHSFRGGIRASCASDASVRVRSDHQSSGLGVYRPV
jgi:hypothetical protein